MRQRYIFIIVIGVLCYGCGEHQDIQVYNVHSETFLKQILNNAKFEISSSEVVLNKGSNVEVQAFSQTLIDYKTIMLKELMDLAEGNAFILSDTIPTETQVKFSTLSQLSGLSLDRKFADEMVLFHEDDVLKFDSAAQYANIKEVRLWAEKHLPTLKSHLEESMRLDKLTDNL
jgi:putative membrane protein